MRWLNVDLVHRFSIHPTLKRAQAWKLDVSNVSADDGQFQIAVEWGCFDTLPHRRFSGTDGSGCLPCLGCDTFVFGREKVDSGHRIDPAQMIVNLFDASSIFGRDHDCLPDVFIRNDAR